jgi:hypothetical protein
VSPYPALLCLLNRHNDGFSQFYLFSSIRTYARPKFGENGKFLLRGKRLRRIEEFYDSVIALQRSEKTSLSRSGYQGRHDVSSRTFGTIR